MSNHALKNEEPPADFGSDSLSQSLSKAVSSEEEIRRLKKALKRSVAALDDWLHSDAEEHFELAVVQASRKRIREIGIVAYIARVQEQNRTALRSKP